MNPNRVQSEKHFVCGNLCASLTDTPTVAISKYMRPFVWEWVLGSGKVQGHQCHHPPMFLGNLVHFKVTRDDPHESPVTMAHIP